MEIIWTKHAEERLKEWQKKLDISRQEVEDLVRSPEQVVPGDMMALVAQKKRQNGLLRAPFMISGDARKILTLYWTSKIERYWRTEA